MADEKSACVFCTITNAAMGKVKAPALKLLGDLKLENGVQVALHMCGECGLLYFPRSSSTVDELQKLYSDFAREN